jgi:cytoskeletal protein CcmA (bactofilin family)
VGRRLRGEEGIGLAMTMAIVTCVLAVAGLLGRVAVHEIRSTGIDQGRLQALDAADAGVAVALDQLAADPDWTGAAGIDLHGPTVDVVVTPLADQGAAEVRQVVATGRSGAAGTGGVQARSVTAVVTITQASNGGGPSATPTLVGAPVWASQNVDVSADVVLSDEVWAGGTASIGARSQVGGSLAASQGITLTGQSAVAGGVQGGAGVQVGNQVVVGGAVSAAGGDVDVGTTASVGGRVTASAAVTVSGVVVGDVEARAGSVTLQPGSDVHGDLRSGQGFTVRPNARLRGSGSAADGGATVHSAVDGDVVASQGVDVQPNAAIGGSIAAGGSVTVRGTVTGDVRSAQSITVQGQGSVGGQRIAPTPLSPVPVAPAAPTAPTTAARIQCSWVPADHPGHPTWSGWDMTYLDGSGGQISGTHLIQGWADLGSRDLILTGDTTLVLTAGGDLPRTVTSAVGPVTLTVISQGGQVNVPDSAVWSADVIAVLHGPSGGLRIGTSASLRGTLIATGLDVLQGAHVTAAAPASPPTGCTYPAGSVRGGGGGAPATTTRTATLSSWQEGAATP